MYDLILAMLCAFLVGGATGTVAGAIITASIFRRRERAAINRLKVSRDQLDTTVKNNQP